MLPSAWIVGSNINLEVKGLSTVQGGDSGNGTATRRSNYTDISAKKNTTSSVKMSIGPQSTFMSLLQQCRRHHLVSSPQPFPSFYLDLVHQ